MGGGVVVDVGDIGENEVVVKFESMYAISGSRDTVRRDGAKRGTQEKGEEA